MNRYYCPHCRSVYYEGYLGEDGECLICNTETIEIPTLETVEQWEKRTGQKYPDTAPAFAKCKADQKWRLVMYKKTDCWDYIVIVATEAGAPPDGWSPE